MSGPDRNEPDPELMYASNRQDEPPTEVDGAILAAAKEATQIGVGEKPLPGRLNPRARWIGALASAAVVLVTASVFFSRQISVEETTVTAPARTEMRAKIADEADIEEVVVTAERPVPTAAYISEDRSVEPELASAQMQRVAVPLTVTEQAWTEVGNLLPEVSVHSPATTRSGDAVIIDTSTMSGARRMHALSRDRTEVYVEVVVYPSLIDVEEIYAEQKAFILADTVNKVSASVTPLENGKLQGRDARLSRVSFESEGETFERTFLFLNVEEQGAAFGLRVVLDPRSETNWQIVERLAILP